MIGAGVIGSLAVIVGILVWLFVVKAGSAISDASGQMDLVPVNWVNVLPNMIRVTVTLHDTDEECQITQMLFPREMGERLGISAPPGFRAVPYTLDDTDSRNSDEPANWVEESNRNDIRWLGAVPLQPDVPATLEFPIHGVVTGEGVLSIQCERSNEAESEKSFIVIPVSITED